MAWTEEQQAEAVAILTAIEQADALHIHDRCDYCTPERVAEGDFLWSYRHAPECPIGRIYRLMAGGTARRG